MAKVTIRIESSERVRKVSKDWLLQSVDGKYDYVETDLPTTETTLLLLQTVESDQFDLKKVIQAVNGL